MFAFDYKTSDVIKMQMEGLAVVSLENLPAVGRSTSVSQIKTIGTLELK